MAAPAARAFQLTITTLFSAVKTGQLNVIENSLKVYGLPRSGPKTTDYLILQTALQKKYREIAKCLINAGCRVKPVATDSGITPLALAFLNEDEEIALMLMKRGTTIYVANNTTTNVLHLAAEQRSLKMLKFVFVCNIGVNHLNGNGKTALQILLEDKNPKSNSQADEINKIRMVRFLLSKGASVNFNSIDGKTALHHVVSLKQADITKFVLQRCNDVNLLDSLGQTALHILLSSTYNCEPDAFEIVKLFIEKRAKLDITDFANQTVSHIAAAKKYFTILNKFLQCQCNVSLQDTNDNTILHRLLENSAHLSGQEICTYFVNSILSAAPLENIKNSSGKTPAHLAAENYHYEILEKMLPKLQDVSVADNNGETLLHILLKNITIANYNLIKCLVNLGANVDMKNTSGTTPLDLAFKIGNKSLLLLMISHSKSLNQRNFPQSKSVLHYLSDMKFNSQSEELEIAEVAEKCIAKGVHVDATDGLSRTPLLAAVSNQFKNMVEVLLKHGANVNYVTQHSTCIEYLISKSTLTSVDLEIADMLVSRGAGKTLTFNSLMASLKFIQYSDETSLLATKLWNNCTNMNMTDEHGNTALHDVLDLNKNTKDFCEDKIMKIVTFLLEGGVSVNAKNKHGITALHLAAKNKHDLVSESLLNSGADVTLLDNADNSVLHFVSMQNEETDANVENNMIDLFVAKGCDLNARNQLGMTPLLTAAKVGCVNAIRALISHGADIKCTVGEHSSNSLHIAIENGYHSVFIEYLLESGANVYDRRKDGKTALHIAAVHGRYETLKTILKRKQDPDVRDYDGRTALHWACWHGNLDVAIYLMNIGADVNALDKLKVTPLMLSQNSNNAMWATLQKHVKRLEIAGVSIPLQSINCIRNYKKRVNTTQLEYDARLEVSKMQQTLIDNNIPLADVLKMKLDKLAIFQNNSAFKELVLSQNFHLDFPTYFYIIKAYFLKGVVRSKLIKESQQAISRLTRLPLPDICAEEIFKFLDNENLINFTQATQLKISGRKRVCLIVNRGVLCKKVCRVNE